MKSYVITILDNERSKAAAQRCIQSASSYDLMCDMHPAITPKDDPESIAAELGIPTDKFRNQYSRYLNCLSAFLSHHDLWMYCCATDEPLIIFEHDAVVVGEVPVNAPFNNVMNIGKPSYGNYNLTTSLGINSLFSKAYFPGAHAYMVKPRGAEKLIEAAKTIAAPTDVFLHKASFPWLEEFYPWSVEVIDNFTTIQAERGCQAKHGYIKEKYEIV